MKKSLFNFYLDHDIKEQLKVKLLELTGGAPKGQIASLIRVLLRQFLVTPNEKVNPLLIEALEVEYNYSQKLNKRSQL